MKNLRFSLFLLAVVFSTLACSINFGDRQSVEGSGVLALQERTVKTFQAIEIAGSADVDVSIGEPQSVIIETDDNILPLIETEVRGDTLVIRTVSNTSIISEHPIHVIIIVKSLDTVRIAGSGNMNIEGLAAEKLQIELPGSGNITATGTAERVVVSLGGSGNILCGDLAAQSAEININGSGNVTVDTSESLDVHISGSGNVHYRGNPAIINKSVSGSGSVVSIP